MTFAMEVITIARIAHVLSRRLEFRDGSDKWKPGDRIQLRLQRLNVFQKLLGSLKKMYDFFTFRIVFIVFFGQRNLFSGFMNPPNSDF